MRITKTSARAVLLAAVVLLALPNAAGACSCVWRGPFLTVAPTAPLIVRARVLGYHGRRGNVPLAMDLRVLETLCGAEPPASLRVWGDNGALCRPYVSQFPIGTEWVFALDGPGSKPGMSPGRTISACGRFWLQVVGGAVVGNLDRADSMDAVQRLPLGRFRSRLAAALQQAAGPTRGQTRFGGELAAGGVYEQPFGPGLIFGLRPTPLGWTITVRERGGDEDLSRLTPPLHGPPNPREVEGWHFRNADNTGPNEAGDKNVNAPGETREFIFSPEVGRTIAGPGATTSPHPDEIETVRHYGQGTLRILDHRLSHLDPGEQAAMAWMRFEVELTWPEPPAADRTPRR